MADVNKSVAINYSASTEQLERALKKIPKITDKEATKAAGQLDKNFKKMEKDANSTSKKVARSMKHMGKSMAAVGAAAAVAVTGVVMLSQKFADLTNELVDASTKTGIAVETLAGLRLAAEGSGLGFANLEGGLIKFQGSILEASRGSKNLVDTFDRLGVSVKDSNGELRDADGVFNDTVKALGSMENMTERNALAMQIFGRQAGPALIQSGALENLESMTDLATEFGIAIDEGGIQSMAQFQRSMAEFETVGMGTLQNVIGAIAGPNSINMALQGASKGVVYMGSIFGTVLGTISQGFENVIGLISVATMAMEGDVDRARVVMGDLQRETDSAVYNLANVFEIAGNELDRFNELSSASTGPQTMTNTAQGAQSATNNIIKMGEASKALIEYNKELNALNDEMMDTTDDLASQVTDRLTPAYEKQRIAVHQIGNEIKNQIDSLDYELYHLLRITDARKMSVEEQERAANISDEIGALEELHAENRIAEINEMTALRDEAYQNRLDQIQTEKDDELQAQQEVIDKYMEKVDVISGLGDTIFQTFDAINEAITTVQQNEIDEMTKSVEEQQKAIDKMVKDGVMGASEAAERKASIEKGLQNQIQEMKLKEFQRERASSLAQIAFGLAKGIAQSLALPPVVRGATIATLTALAGAQTAVVTAQQPPKFDVGGMVGQSDGGPDVVNANLLRGEAVLDRATVDRLGGESGVQQLQNGGGVGSQVVIIQPFKHIDRYNRARSKRMATRVGSGGY